MEIERDYLDHFRIEYVAPQPRTLREKGNDLVYVFDVGPGIGLVWMRFDLTTDRFGYIRARIRRMDGPSVELKQFIFP